MPLGGGAIITSALPMKKQTRRFEMPEVMLQVDR